MNITKEQIIGWLEQNKEAVFSDIVHPPTVPMPSLVRLIENCIQDLGPKWISVENELPDAEHGHYMVACEGGAVIESYFIGDRQHAIDYFGGEKSCYSRKRFGKNNAHFSVCHDSGYKVQYWTQRLTHPEPPK